jgi:subtilisin-like proprotein convertase family protein
MNRFIVGGTLVLGLLHCANAQLFEAPRLNAPVPDGDSAGLVSTVEVSGIGLSPFRVEVQLSLLGVGDGGYTGDLYVTLQHHSGFSVLLNRPGSREERPGGYGDASGMNVVFSDLAPADIHDYRLALSGSHTIPVDGLLTGVWQPDGRNVDPGSAVWDAPRTALLDQFSGMDPNGSWNLFVADLSTGGEFELRSWSVQITPVPEPETYAVVGGAGMVLWAVVRHRRRSLAT